MDPETDGMGMSCRHLLADDLAQLLAAEPLGLSCRELARQVRRRSGTVLEVLRADARFVRDGDRRGSRWRLNTSTSSREQMGTQHRAGLEGWVTLDAGIPVLGEEAPAR